MLPLKFAFTNTGWKITETGHREGIRRDGGRQGRIRIHIKRE
jgi:hypothetical protein